MKRGETKILEKGASWIKGWCLKKGRVGASLRTIKDFCFNNDYSNKKSACVIFRVKKLVSPSIIFF